MKYRIISLLIGFNLLCLSLLFFQPGGIIAVDDFHSPMQEVATDSRVAEEIEQSDGLTHVVQQGETLSEIAEAYNISMLALMDLNNIADPDDIYFDQILTLPVVKRVTPTPTEMLAIEEEATATSIALEKPSLSLTPTATPLSLAATLNPIYIVERDDTIDRIALKMGVDVDALRAINNLSYIESYRLSIDQPLIIPATHNELRVKTPNQEYVAEPGDSLGSIAEKHDILLADLLAINHIISPDTISIGQRLTIPGKEVHREEAQEIIQSFEAAYSGFYYYTIKPADTLSELAERFDSTIPAILTYNSISSIAKIFSGLELRIPFGPPPTPLRVPPIPASATQFLVSLSRQQCWVFQGDRTVRQWSCSTGYEDWATHTGTFAVKTKLEMAESSAHRLDMPYWLGIYDVGEFENGIHGLPVDWDTGEKLWTGLVGQKATFGCAMLVDDDAANLFELAYLGMPVHIID